MVELNEHVISEAAHEGRTMVPEQLFSLVERHHPHQEPGVPREVLEAYADGVEDTVEYRFDADEFLREVDSQLTDSETWAGEDAFYRVDGRLSRYPARWHRELGGTTDVREYIAFLQDEEDGYLDDVSLGGAGRGIPEQPLLDIVAIVGRVDREEAKEKLEELRDRGEVVEDADQHPNAGVYLADRDEERRDESLDPNE